MLSQCNFLLIKAGCDILDVIVALYDKPALMPKTLHHYINSCNLTPLS